MGHSIAYQYYVKALDCYPYNLEEVQENLHYALSYDPEHFESNLLQARFLGYELRLFEDCMEHVELCISHNPSDYRPFVIGSYALLMLNKFQRAQKMLDHAFKLHHRGSGMIYQRQALLHEMQGNIAEAKKELKKALKVSIYSDEHTCFNASLERVNSKLKKSDKQRKNKKTDKKKKN